MKNKLFDSVFSTCLQGPFRDIIGTLQEPYRDFNHESTEPSAVANVCLVIGGCIIDLETVLVLKDNRHHKE